MAAASAAGDVAVVQEVLRAGRKILRRAMGGKRKMILGLPLLEGLWPLSTVAFRNCCRWVKEDGGKSRFFSCMSHILYCST